MRNIASFKVGELKAIWIEAEYARDAANLAAINAAYDAFEAALKAAEASYDAARDIAYDAFEAELKKTQENNK